MVQKLDLQHASAFCHASGQPEIDVTRCWITGWMVMNQDKSVSRMADCGLKDFAGMSEAFVECSFRNLADCNQAKTCVKQNHAKRLAIKSAHLGPEELIDRLGMVERF